MGKAYVASFGFVAWGGCGFMGPTMGKIEGVLPNAGVGLRIEVQPRMNVRLDFGRNFANDQSLFYFNMTEAFLMEVNTMQTEYIFKSDGCGFSCR